MVLKIDKCNYANITKNDLCNANLRYDADGNAVITIEDTAHVYKAKLGNNKEAAELALESIMTYFAEDEYNRIIDVFDEYNNCIKAIEDDKR